MYEDFYGFTQKPFSLTPDPQFFFLSSVHKEALAFLRYGLRDRKGFVQITGEIGCGKTTLLRHVLRDLEKNVRTGYVINPRLEFPDLLRAILEDLEAEPVPAGSSKNDLLSAFYRFIAEQHGRGDHVIIILDEAQHLSVDVLEELRMLSNFELAKDKLFQIVFVGQPELRTKLRSPQLEQLRQRISVRYHINPLNIAESAGYIKHRLGIVGVPEERELFTEGACEAIHYFSHGVPRLINIVCDAALLAGYADGKRSIGERVISEVVEELSLDKIKESVAAVGTTAGETPQNNVPGSEPELQEGELEQAALGFMRVFSQHRSELNTRVEAIDAGLRELSAKSDSLQERLGEVEVKHHEEIELQQSVLEDLKQFREQLAADRAETTRAQEGMRMVSRRFENVVKSAGEILGKLESQAADSGRDNGSGDLRKVLESVQSTKEVLFRAMQRFEQRLAQLETVYGRSGREQPSASSSGTRGVAQHLNDRPQPITKKPSSAAQKRKRTGLFRSKRNTRQ